MSEQNEANDGSGLGCSDREWETECPNRLDKQHCNCWYDGEKCCACGDICTTDDIDSNPARGGDE